jgi:hypothetical protein
MKYLWVKNTAFPKFPGQEIALVGAWRTNARFKRATYNIDWLRQRRLRTPDPSTAWAPWIVLCSAEGPDRCLDSLFRAVSLRTTPRGRPALGSETADRRGSIRRDADDLQQVGRAHGRADRIGQPDRGLRGRYGMLRAEHYPGCRRSRPLCPSRLGRLRRRLSPRRRTGARNPRGVRADGQRGEDG